MRRIGKAEQRTKPLPQAQGDELGLLAVSYEPRLTDAPTSSTYSRMRAPTSGGLGNEVAALSRYTVCIAVPPGASFSSVYHTAAQM